MSNSGPATVNMSYVFIWNVEQYISASKTFAWQVGDGPLYWYRIEWVDLRSLCQPEGCAGTASCTVVPKDCYDDNDNLCPPILPVCPADVPPDENCMVGNLEIWHVLATSLADLCHRLNTEACNPPPVGKVFRKIQKFDRPALCCDAANSDAAGVYEDVDYCEACECISYIDPCDPVCAGRLQSGACDTDTTASLITPQSMFGFSEISVPTKSGFSMADIKIMTPEVDSIVTNCGILSSNLKLKHNLNKASILKEFISRNKLNLEEEVVLAYIKASDSWQKVIHLNGHNEKWTIVFSWLCFGDGWKSDMNVTRQIDTKKQITKISTTFAQGKMARFGVDFDYNTSTNKVTIKQPMMVKSKTMHDEIGLFNGNWSKNPYLTFNIIEKG